MSFKSLLFLVVSTVFLGDQAFSDDLVIEPVVFSQPKVQSTTYKAKNFYHLIGMKGFSDQLLSEHFELYQGYVNQTNVLHNQIAQLIDTNQTKIAEYHALKKAFAFEFDGMKMHEFYFENLGGRESFLQEAVYIKKLFLILAALKNGKKILSQLDLFEGLDGLSLILIHSKTKSSIPG